MRQRISFVFYCLASGIIMLQIASSLMALSGEENQHSLVHMVSRQSESQTKMIKQNTEPKIDFQKMAKDLTQEKY
ncbi:hypothetical protein [Photobacterium sp. DNB22_13_2]